MRFVRFLCNLGIFLLSYFMIFAVGVMSYSVVSWGVSSDEAIHFASQDKAAGQAKVNFYDLWAFQATDIAVNVTSEPKPYVRNIFRNNGKWADYAINFVAGTFKPIIVPQAQIDNIVEQRTASLFEDLTGNYGEGTRNRLPKLRTKYVTEADTYAAFVELACFDYGSASNSKSTLLGVDKIEVGIESGDVDTQIVFEDFNDKYGLSWDIMRITKHDGTIITIPKTDENNITILNESVPLFTENSKHLNTVDETSENWCLFGKNYQYWALDKNDALGNRIWQANKYWDDRYTNYVYKFVKYDEKNNILLDANGKPIIKTEVIFLCVIQWVALIVAAIFTIRYPITIIQARVSARRNRKKGDADAGVVL